MILRRSGIVVISGRQINKNELADLVEGSLKRVMRGQGPDGGPGGDRLDSRSAMKDAGANIERGIRALARAVSDKTSVHRAMFRNGLGWVDFVWGSEGRAKASGKTAGASGLSHIIEARQRKDGLGEQEAIAFLGGVVETIARGVEFSRQEIERSTRVGIEHNGTIAWLVRSQGSNSWVVTAYEKSPDGRAAGRATDTPTQSAASLTRDGSVAGLDVNVAQEGRDRMNQIAFDLRDYLPGGARRNAEPASQYHEQNRRLREQHITHWQKAKTGLKRQSTPGVSFWLGVGGAPGLPRPRGCGNLAPHRSKSPDR